MSEHIPQEGAVSSSETGTAETKAEQSTRAQLERMLREGGIEIDESPSFGGLAIIGAPQRSSSSEPKKKE
jgi:hypothetical protein